MNEVYAASIVAVPTIVGLVNAATAAGLPTRFAPLAAVLVGLALQVFQVYVGHLPLYEASLTGIGLGLGAVGLHAGTRATIAPKPAKKNRTMKLPLPKVPVNKPDGTPGQS